MSPLFGSRYYQRPKDCQPRLVRERAQGTNYGF